MHEISSSSLLRRKTNDCCFPVFIFFAILLSSCLQYVPSESLPIIVTTRKFIEKWIMLQANLQWKISYKLLVRKTKVTSMWAFDLTLPIPILDEEKKFSQFFIFALLCGASKGFMKALKAFIKPFASQQRSVKIKI